MRKVFFCIVLLLSVMTISAQGVEKRNQFAVELGFGGNGKAGMDLGLRWQMNFLPYLAWDVVTAKALTNFDPADDLLVQGMSGLRLTSPVYSGISIYGTGKVGYGYYPTSIDTGGVCFEIGVGINLNKHVYAGYAFNNQSYSMSINMGSGRKPKWEDKTMKIKLHEFRIGYTF